MIDAERDAALALAHTLLISAAELSATGDRLINGARFALAQAAVRHDIHGDAIMALQAKQGELIKSISELRELVLADLNERQTP